MTSMVPSNTQVLGVKSKEGFYQVNTKKLSSSALGAFNSIQQSYKCFHILSYWRTYSKCIMHIQFRNVFVKRLS